MVGWLTWASCWGRSGRCLERADRTRWKMLRRGNRYHQQYLYKNPGGYCGIGGTGVACPVGLISDEA